MRVLLINSKNSGCDDILDHIEQEYLVDVANNTDDGLFYAQTNEYDAIVLDAALPDITSSEIYKAVTQGNSHTPVLLLSDTFESSSSLSCLESGADVYVSGALPASELGSQLRALIKRRYHVTEDQIIHGPICLNLKQKSVFCNGHAVDLRRKEYQILEYLLLNKGRYVTKEEILEHIWKEGVCVFSNTVEVHVKALRTKLQNQGAEALIRTKRGFGYIIDTT